MDTETVTLFFALLAVAAQIAVVVVAACAVGGVVSPALARARAALVTHVGPQAYALGAAVAAVCTLGSLYLSEVADLVPCRLCWYQRAAMYPQVLLFGLAALGRSRRLGLLAAATVTAGGAVSTYHVLLERKPDLEADGMCDLYNRCSTILLEHLGYVTIPTMALSGFALLLCLALLGRAAAGAPTAATDPTAPTDPVQQTQEPT